ncbi:MAG: helix-turn-helix domain-containing protein [Thermococci archaeon]|nr:helix-turn-helix domain-containing protein [Thermococci archaeon]
MKGDRIMDAIKEGPKTAEEISKATGLGVAEVRRYLLRFAEQGKVESVEKEGKILWRIKEESEEERKFRYTG